MNYYGGSDLTESGEIAVLSLVKETLKNTKQPVVFDVGANDGHYIKQAVRILSPNTRFHCFEPSTNAFKRLGGSIASGANVALHQLGVGERSEKLVLRAPVHGSVLGSLHAHNSNEQSVAEEIQLISLDEFCGENGIEHIHFLKMDIEGHEVAALKGANTLLRGRKISMIQFEFGQPNIASRTFIRDFYSILGSDYEIYRVVKDGITPMGAYSEESEVFLTANYFAKLKS